MKFTSLIFLKIEFLDTIWDFLTVWIISQIKNEAKMTSVNQAENTS